MPETLMPPTLTLFRLHPFILDVLENTFARCAISIVFRNMTSP
jgi:hypothetical protein